MTTTPYRLATDHTWHLRGQFALVPVYINGRRWASAGLRAALAIPVFASHSAAIRHLLEQPNVPALLARVGLTPADIMDLRLSVRALVADPTGATLIAPCVRYNPAGDTYELHQQGNVLCAHPRGEVILALLRAERFEPGYIRRALDPQYTIEEAAQDADEAERARRKRAASDASTRAFQRAQEDAERARRRATPAEPFTGSLDDLFDTL